MRESCTRKLLPYLTLVCLLASLHGCATTGQSPEDKLLDKEEIEKTVQNARQAQEAGKPGVALFYYERVLQEDPDNQAALMGSARLALALENYKQAGDYYDKVLKSSPDDVDALEGRGLSRLRLKEYRQAEEDLTRSVSLDPRRWQAWNALGILADLRWEHAAAQANYQKALGILPDYPTLLNNMGYSLMMSHNYPGAEQYLRKGLSYAPQDKRLRTNLGITLAWLGRYRDGYTVLADGINAAEASNNIGYIALLRKDYLVAIDYFNKALELSPTYFTRAANNLQNARQKLKEQAASPGSRIQ